jgi:DNA-directed RNA polymerase specialized sigma24 family protein
MVGFSREREALILANLDLVSKLSKNTPDPEEFFSIGQLALVIAAGRHDLSRPAEAFRAYAKKCVTGAIQDEHRRRAAERSVLAGIKPPTPQPEVQWCLADLPPALQEQLAHPRVQRILARSEALPERSSRALRRICRLLVCRELCAHQT